MMALIETHVQIQSQLVPKFVAKHYHVVINVNGNVMKVNAPHVMSLLIQNVLVGSTVLLFPVNFCNSIQVQVVQENVLHCYHAVVTGATESVVQMNKLQ